MTEHHFGGFRDKPPPSDGSPLADEAARLLGSVQDWANKMFSASPEGHPSSDCQWCPICQFMGVLRGERPELTERVAEAGTALVSAFRVLVDAATTSGRGGPDRHPGSATGPRPSGAPRVQRINLGDHPERDR